jgi:hypothetical protein
MSQQEWIVQAGIMVAMLDVEMWVMSLHPCTSPILLPHGLHEIDGRLYKKLIKRAWLISRLLSILCKKCKRCVYMHLSCRRNSV